jgi:hypothetical protein
VLTAVGFGRVLGSETSLAHPHGQAKSKANDVSTDAELLGAPRAREQSVSSTGDKGHATTKRTACVKPADECNATSPFLDGWIVESVDSLAVLCRYGINVRHAPSKRQRGGGRRPEREAPKNRRH